jgi:hypothetical protein
MASAMTTTGEKEDGMSKKATREASYIDPPARAAHQRRGMMAKHKKPKTFSQVYCGPEVCDCGAVLGTEEWTCSACGRDPLDESEPDYMPDEDNQE